MAAAYTEIPHNYNEIESMLETRMDCIKTSVIRLGALYFYDTCSFRIHSNLSENGRSRLADYYKNQGGEVIIIRCVLMELASDSGIINEEYINYLRFLFDAGIRVLLLNEEDLFDVLSECFSTNAKVNEYLIWAVRMSKSPVSTITKTLKNDIKLSEEVIDGNNSGRSDLYRRFFSSVRKNKERGDNLGEELIGICVHILSHLPGMRDGKLCVITDDKAAAGKIDALMKRTNSQFRGSKIILFSTPKLVQYIYQAQRKLTEDEMTEILSQGTSGKVTVMGTTAYDLAVNLKISMTCRELAQKIMEPNGINILF